MLHLARDPRGIVGSRDKLDAGESLNTKSETRSIQSTCQGMTASLSYVTSPIGAQQFDNKYKVVR